VLYQVLGKPLHVIVERSNRFTPVSELTGMDSVRGSACALLHYHLHTIDEFGYHMVLSRYRLVFLEAAHYTCDI
jgi:hypothetical protein